MNYLAHVYLSFGDAEVTTGNLISDFIKGKKKFDYQPGILKGIDLHRAIDEFTDGHPVNKQSAGIFKPAYGRYGSAFLDVAYDHFLAIELVAGGQQAFENFTFTAYQQVASFEPLLPQSFRNIFPYMRLQNWLYNYQYTWGIEKSFAGLVYRAKYISESKSAIQLFEKNYQNLQRSYNEFFPQLKEFSLRKNSDIH